MDKRKLQAVINRINDNVKQYKKEIRYYNKNKDDFNDTVVFERVTHLEGRLNEAYYVLRQLEYLKESIKGDK
mgnify:CR=1 FL=1